jgi:hypothetical protein
MLKKLDQKLQQHQLLAVSFVAYSSRDGAKLATLNATKAQLLNASSSVAVRLEPAPAGGTAVTCFTSTKVQILTQLRRRREAGASSCGRYSVYLLYWYKSTNTTDAAFNLKGSAKCEGGILKCYKNVFLGVGITLLTGVGGGWVWVGACVRACVRAWVV